jgi:hypothetical protein
VAPVPFEIDFRVSGNSEKYTGQGWSNPEAHGRWTNAAQAELRIPGLDPASNYRCEMVVSPFVAPPLLPSQVLHISSGLTTLFFDNLDGDRRIGFDIPSVVISPSGDLTITMRIPFAAAPFSFNLSTDGRLLGISVWNATFEPAGIANHPATAPTNQFIQPARTVPVPPQVQPISTPPRPTAPAPPPRTRIAGNRSPIAAVTMVFNEPEYLPIWIRHYGAHVGEENCYIIDHGSDDGSTADVGSCNLLRIPRSPYDPILQSTFAAKFCSALLCWYGRVLFADVDEIVLPDPQIAKTLTEYALRPLPDIVSAIGLNILHRPDVEAEIDLGRRITEQRPYVFACSPMCKPILIGRDVRWAGGSHSADAPVAFDHLYMFHLRWFDFAGGLRRIAKTRAMEWAHHQSGGHQRVTDAVFATQLRGFAALPCVDDCDFTPDSEPMASFLKAVLDSQAGRETDSYRIDLSIWWSKLWRIPPRFVGLF